ncbi:hypothetical protein HA402_012965 [Bradysia odoriphaga]|nr:hypothetical protein HA402_004987 [Bradysia odoriphaga]KAG4078835.1 hypothetical protein HA402_012965 [Bradysia odoriphaga]
MNAFLKEFNDISQETTTKFPKRFLAEEFEKDGQYEIEKILYVSTPVHDRSVVMYIRDTGKILRSFFTPEKYAETFRKNFEDPSTINCYELYLQFNGFKDEDKKIHPQFEIVYKGQAQHA